MKILYMKTTYKKQKCHYTNVVHDTDTGNQIFLKRGFNSFEFILNQSILHIDLLQRFEKKKSCELRIYKNYELSKVTTN